MSIQNEIAADFAEVLADGLAGTLFFPETGTSVSATVSEISREAVFEIGGVRSKRSWTATALRSAFLPGALPRSGNRVECDAETHRVIAVRCRAESPLVEIDFTEK